MIPSRTRRIVHNLKRTKNLNPLEGALASVEREYRIMEGILLLWVLMYQFAGCRDSPVSKGTCRSLMDNTSLHCQREAPSWGPSQSTRMRKVQQFSLIDRL